MGDFAVDDEDFLYAVFDGVGAGVYFGDHAAVDGAVFFEGFGVGEGEGVVEGAFVFGVFHDAVDVAHEDETFGVEGSGDFGGCGVCIDVVGIAFFVYADGGDDGDVAAVKGAVDDLGVNLVDFADPAEFFVFGVDLDHISIDAAEADGFATEGGEVGHEAFIDFAGENHLDDFHGGCVGDAEAVFEVGFDVEGVEHGVDVGAAAVDEDDVHADEVEEKDVLHDVLLQDRIGHGVSAVFGDYVFTGVFFDVWYGLGEDFRPDGIVCVHGVVPFYY